MGIAIIDKLKDQYDALVVGVKASAEAELIFQKTVQKINKATISVMKAINKLIGFSVQIPDDLAAQIKDKLDVDVKELAKYAKDNEFLSKLTAASLVWETLLSNEKTVIDAFVQKFADYMLRQVEQEKDIAALIYREIGEIQHRAKEISDLLSVYEYGSIRQSLRDALTELNLALGYIISGLQILDEEKMPPSQYIFLIRERYQKAQDLIGANLQQVYTDASAYKFDGDALEAAMDALVDSVGAIVSKMDDFLFLDIKIRNARWCLIGIEELVSKTVGAVERYQMQAYLEGQEIDLKTVIERIDGDLDKFKFIEARLIRTGLYSYMQINDLLKSWGAGGIANAFSNHFNSRVAAVNFINDLKNHSYFADLDYTGDAQSTSVLIQNVGGKLLAVGDRLVEVAADSFDGTTSGPIKGLVNDLSAEVGAINSSVNSLWLKLDSYGKFEDTTGTLTALDDFFDNIFNTDMVGFLLGLSAGFQVLNWFRPDAMSLDFASALENPIVHMCSLRLKVTADLVLKGQLTAEQSKAYTKAQLLVIEREKMKDVNIVEAMQSHEAALDNRVEYYENEEARMNYLINGGMVA